jgi:hypothetical protein
MSAELEGVLEGVLRWAVVKGSALEVLATVADDSIDAAILDPPWGLGTRSPSAAELIAYLTGAELDTGGDFMGRTWKLLSVATWREVYRVMKPGAHLLVHAGTRIFPLLAIGPVAAGFELRDTISDEEGALRWYHGEGMPKGGETGAKIDKLLGAKRPVIGERVLTGNAAVSTAEKGGTYGVRVGSAKKTVPITAPATDEAKRWDDTASQLKPAWEPILLFRKPFCGSLTRNVLAHGTGVLNTGACRIGTGADKGEWPITDREGGKAPIFDGMAAVPTDTTKGRWPANAVFCHTPACRVVGSRVVKRTEVVSVGGSGSVPREGLGGSARGESWPEEIPVYECAPGCAVAELDRQSGAAGSTGGPVTADMAGMGYGGGNGAARTMPPRTNGGASKFFYCPKPTAAEKDAGLPEGTENRHPTVKPIELYRWLVRLACPPGGVVLDPTCGSGVTGAAAVLEQRRFVGIELDEDNEGHVEIARARLAHWSQDFDAVQGQLFG